MHGAKARVARQSRIYVEGRHDAELVEKVWGDDLRIEGVVVEYLGGVDDLADHLRDFRPGPGRRVGVLVDHLVPGLEGEPDRRRRPTLPRRARTSSWWATRSSTSGRRSSRSGSASSSGPTSRSARTGRRGTCQRLGWPHRDQADIARAWKHVLGGVRGFQDLDPALLGRVEELIDFVTLEP